MSNHPVRISLYIANIIYKFGGTESYTANLIEALQKVFSGSHITVITEYWPETERLTSSQLVLRLNQAYGTKITEDTVSVEYIPSKQQRGRWDTVLFQRQLHAITREYDLFFYCSRGLLTGKAKKNVAIIHFPMDRKITFPTYQKLPLLKPLAAHTDKEFMAKYDYFFPNSHFTAHWLNEKWGIPEEKVHVLYPPVTLIASSKLQNVKQRNNIFVCSRIEKSKKIEDLIRAFSDSDFLNKNCTLTVAGSIKNESPEYIRHLQAINPKVTFVFEPSREQIEELFLKATIFWHAKGFGETDPYQMEHFGITTVEAMSAGCIPVVINKGGQVEIVTEGCGFKWDTLEELVHYTERLCKTEVDSSAMISCAQQRSSAFSKEAFANQLKDFFASKNLV